MPDSPLYGMSATLLDGREFCFGDLMGKVVLVVNTAAL